MVFLKKLIKNPTTWIIFAFLLFSMWLLGKSFSYTPATNTLFIARNVVGDFGLHLGLIQSFALGNNFPPQLPFFPGPPLPYHFVFDLLVGLFVRLGLRIDLALNGLSIICFTALLYLMYKFAQLLFGKSRVLGILSALFFILPSSFTFVDFFKTQKLGFSFFTNLWRLPDYINKGPFDKSIISIFFTLNVYENQRHLILGLCIGLFILYVLYKKILENKQFSYTLLVFLGVLLGLLARVHSLLFVGTFMSVFFLSLCFRKPKVLLMFIPALAIFLPQLPSMLQNKTIHPLLVLGFLSGQPFNLYTFVLFWLLNTGIAFFLIPISFFSADKKQKLFFLSVLPLFILPNILQFSYRIDHNHSLFNFFFIFANCYLAYFLIRMFRRKLWNKVLAILLLFFLTISGVINLMPIKNDYHLPFVIHPRNQFMQWIVAKTNPNSIFLEKADLLDPVVLSGRRNYFGDTYYTSVMGYKLSQRDANTKKFFEAQDSLVFKEMKQEGIDYIVLPLKPVSDFPYTIHKDFLESQLSIVYKDENVEVLKL